MSHVTSSLAEAATPMDVVVQQTIELQRAPPQQEPRVDIAKGIQSGSIQGLQETQSMDIQWFTPIASPEGEHIKQTVTQAVCGSSLVMNDESRPIVAANPADCGTSHTEVTTKTQGTQSGCANVAAAEPSIVPVNEVDAKVTSLDVQEAVPLVYKANAQVKNKRIGLSRAAATAATAVMARQVKQEAGALQTLISSLSVLEKDEEMDTEHGTKKRTTTKGARPAAKRSRVGVSRNTLEKNSAKQSPPRGRKRRQVSVCEAEPTEASPVITDLPLLPFTSSSSKPVRKDKSRVRSKSSCKNKTKTKDLTMVKVDDDEEDRCCGFCEKVANICVLMHCHACRRVYHAQCFVHAFKPYVDQSVPIWDQMQRLQQEAPEHRGNVFRCASCKAAFLDFYGSGGYLWDCDCVTCSQPEKALPYRQRKLVQMMNEMELERQRKKELKGQKKTGTPSASEKSPGSPTPIQSNATPRSRQRGSSTVIDDPIVCLQKSSRSSSATRDTSPEGDKSMDIKPVEELKQSELSGDDLICAVDVLQNEKNGGWCFSVVCSRTLSFRQGGIAKTGQCTWSRQEQSTIHCHCCDKVYGLHEFVGHTDHSLIKFVHASKGPMSFLFVEHRDTAEYTLLGDFQLALRSWHRQESTKNSLVKSCHSSGGKQEAPAVAETPPTRLANVAATTDVTHASLSRIRALALFKRPKHESCESISAARLVCSEALNFVAQVVCLPPKYVMNMQNGALADLVVRSRTPAPEDSFPRKAGWLAFNRNPVSARRIVCFCCKHDFGFDEFVRHAGIPLVELQKKPSQLLYIVERLDKSALVPFNTFLSDLEYVTTNGADSFLDELQLPPSSPFAL
uniref:Tify domain-containing protein n=1 Tax=Peronospora matthiolae TaxID=2874970 RepID=A0AAV1UWG2_9STRA